MGRPVEVYNSYGNVVWQADYDIYSDLRNIKGIRDFIPFRQMGQYEDDETRLYYNRFRYYDPRIGNYISQDPIRLAGNNPTLYGYVAEPNNLADIFGLECFRSNPKKKVNSANLSDIVRTPTTDPEDFVPIKNSRNYKNINTDEIWSKSFTNHSHSNGGEWKVGIGKSAPAKKKKITVSQNGHIIKIDK